MGRIHLLSLFTIIALIHACSATKAGQCHLAKNCQDCMGRGPKCSWCFDDIFDDTTDGPGFRCSDVDTLIRRNCPADKIQSRNSSILDGRSNIIINSKNIVMTYALILFQLAYAASLFLVRSLHQRNSLFLFALTILSQRASNFNRFRIIPWIFIFWSI